MTSQEMDRARFERMEAFLLGRLSPIERDDFEAAMVQEPTLRAELEELRENMLSVELGGLHRTLRQVGQEDAARHAHQEASPARSWTHYLRYAAMVALFVSAAIWWSTRPSTEEALFAQHYVADPGLPVPMSATDDHVFQDAMVAYKLGDFAEARSKWGPLLQAEPANDTLRFYIASAALAEADASAAIPLFKSLVQDNTSPFYDKSRWFLFLAYVRTGQQDSLAGMGMENDPVHGEQARAIKAQLHR